MNKNKRIHYKIVKRICIVIVLILIIVIFNWILNKNIFISKFNVFSSRLPESFNNYRIIQLTDIHSIRTKKQAYTIVKKVKKENPNIIFITGDLIDSNFYSKQEKMLEKKEIENVETLTLDFLKEISLISPVYYVYGNHESCIFNYEDTYFADSLSDIGINIINNTVGYLYNGNSYIKLIGLEDPYVFAYDSKYKNIGGTNQEKVEFILDEMYKDSSENIFTILLSHRPELFKTYSKYNIDLIFSGHAHGGIIRIPFIGGLYSTPQGLFPKYSAGKYTDSFHTMILGRGIGRSREPIRIFNPPEIVLVTLNRK